MHNTQSVKTGVEMRNDTTKSSKLDTSPTSEVCENTIERELHDPEHPFLIVSKSLVDDPEISMECAYFLMKLLAKPRDWIIIIPQLLKELNGRCGENKLYKLLAEAIGAGYMKREDVFIKGRRIRCKYYVSEYRRYRDNSKKDARGDENRDRENHHRKLLSNENTTNIQRYKEGQAEPAHFPTKKEEQAHKDDGGFQLPKQMYYGKLPRPRSRTVVNETKSLMKEKFIFGGKSLRIHDDDHSWFYGFTPYLIKKACEEINQEYKKLCHVGKKTYSIWNYTALLFKTCCRLEKERNSN